MPLFLMGFLLFQTNKSYTDHEFVLTATGRTGCCSGGEVLELNAGVTTSRRAKLPMALFTIIGGGVGDVILP